MPMAGVSSNRLHFPLGRLSVLRLEALSQRAVQIVRRRPEQATIWTRSTIWMLPRMLPWRNTVAAGHRPVSDAIRA
jgi:hypothetical protein